jgi:hypothetical protein
MDLTILAIVEFQSLSERNPLGWERMGQFSRDVATEGERPVFIWLLDPPAQIIENKLDIYN